MREISHYIGGALYAGTGGRFGEVLNPNTGEVQAKVAFGDAADLDAAVRSAEAAFPAWAAVNPQRRARVLFEFKRLVEAKMGELAELLSSEHGKVVADSRGDIQRGLEVVEFGCGAPHLLKGEYTQGAGPGIDVYSMRQPLGVVCGITPFNFPAMIPMWMFGVAIACGNTFILKPSEKDPSVPVRLAELMMEAGAPAGVLNVVHGDKAVVDAVLPTPRSKRSASSAPATSPAMSTQRARRRGNGSRPWAEPRTTPLIMPDADLDQTVRDLLGAAYGSAGERCMAVPVVVPVGERTADDLRARLVDGIEGLKVGVSTDAAADYGPVVTGVHRRRVLDYIQMGVDEGAELVVDGRGFGLQGYEQGFFIGPTLFDHVRPTMRSYQDEIFGPVLQMVRTEGFEEALALPSAHQYGNGVAIYTRNGRLAREFADRVQVGDGGDQCADPVPVGYHSFGGWKRSAFGDANQYGMDGVRFYTKVKTVTARWPEEAAEQQGSAFVIPTMQ